MKGVLESAELIRHFEGCELKAYLCPAQKWTIGYGSTKHPDGRNVKAGDTITQAQAEEYLGIEIQRRINAVNVPLSLTANQLGAVVSFAYNVGVGAYNKSTLCKLINGDRTNPAIRAEFMKWNKSGGKVLNGLTRRRKAEADLYFKP